MSTAAIFAPRSLRAREACSTAWMLCARDVSAPGFVRDHHAPMPPVPAGCSTGTMLALNARSSLEAAGKLKRHARSSLRARGVSNARSAFSTFFSAGP
ncbi:hypothetical protein [Bradyrhizobium sp. LMG 9283]|uniref:hypothetical protein n=1 Tax=Bradyrhizobium sp. LMG 9283 TaxID=592064 RepID=UPI00389002FB